MLGVVLVAACGLAIAAIGAGLLQSQRRAWAAVLFHPFGASLALCLGYFWVTRTDSVVLSDLLDVALWGHLLPGLVFVGVTVVLARRWQGSGSVLSGGQRRFRFGLKAMQIGLVYMGITHLDRLMLGLLSDSRELGTYAVAARLAGLMYLVVYFFPPLVGPVFAREHSDRDKKQVYEASTFLVTTAVLPMVLVMLWGGGTIVTGLFGVEYGASVRILQVLAASSFLVAATGNNGLLLQMGGRENTELKLSLLTFGLNFLLNLWLISRWGGWGAAVATAISLLVSTACKTVVCRREWGVLPALISRRRHLVGAAAFCAACGACRWVPNLPPYGPLIAGTAVYLLTLSPREMRSAVADLTSSGRRMENG
jgi:O-antigen/teichoic acid export membrane protein